MSNNNNKVAQEIIKSYTNGVLGEENTGFLISELASGFSEDQLKLFAQSLRNFEKYDQKNDFVIDFDDAWKLCGYSQKSDAKRVLNKHLQENVHYKIFTGQSNSGMENTFQQDCLLNTTGVILGRPKETILLTVRGFKSFCIKSKTKNAHEVHEYFLDFEEKCLEFIRNQHLRTIESQKLQLENSERTKNTRDLERESELITGNRGKKLVYLGLVEPDIVKFGCTSGDIQHRVSVHKRRFSGFVLKYVVTTPNHDELEKLIKIRMSDHIVTRTYSGENYTELIKLSDNLTMSCLYEKVVNLRDEVETKFADNSLWLSLEKMRKKYRKTAGELVKYKKMWKHTKNHYHKLSHEIGDTYAEDFRYARFLVEGEIPYHAKFRIFVRFIDDFFEEYESQEKFFSNDDLVEMYLSYVDREKGSEYALTSRQFFNEFSYYFKDSFSKTSRVIEDRKVWGKLVKFDHRMMKIVVDLEVSRKKSG